MKSFTLIEHKKLLVRLFKQHLPGLKLSATSSRFANGTSIELRPKPGFMIGDPAVANALYFACSATAYSRFDCLDDSYSVVRHSLVFPEKQNDQDPPVAEPQVVMMGAKFVTFRDNRDGAILPVTLDQVTAMLSDPEWPKVSQM